MRYTEADPMAERSYAQQLNDTSANNGEQQPQTTAHHFSLFIPFLGPPATSTATQTIELQENAPIIYANPTIITVQPGEGESRFRRPIPISTLDWISTPRSHLNAITGTQFLDGVEQLEIQQRITVESANLIGSVEKNFSPIGPSFTVYNAVQEPLCNIYGPFTCDCCMFKEAQFQIVSLDGSRQVASLIHQWDHFAVDYILLLTFPVDTDVRLKSLLLGASFLIEYLYFHRIRRASRR
ncbi:Phospholipid scramblase 3 [Trachymyrmex cornetzi]|uniref:Phospholipid scramblase n=1 Tax=Trachymyrmex cornetzi TaxID=471704 RepID=A0A151IS55_9HYME|nr:Phospholipid scramblase 3 [Trachymyrmex cornetzi]